MDNQNTEITPRSTPDLTEKADANTIAVAPPVDIYENQNELLVVADFPGVPSESLNINLDGSELVIAGTQSLPEAATDVRALSFSRTFRVPNTVDPNGISAELDHGVLRVHLAKSESAKPRRIEVKSA